jgi:hypothetical protein
MHGEKIPFGSDKTHHLASGEKDNFKIIIHVWNAE